MRFELLRQRVEHAERHVESCMDRAQAHRQAFGQAWRRGWSPGRIVVAGLVSGFLVGRAEPLSRLGGSRWLQMLGTVSSMLASLQAATAPQEAGAAADVATQDAASTDRHGAGTTGAASVAPGEMPIAAGDPLQVRAPAPAEAATDVSEH